MYELKQLRKSVDVLQNKVEKLEKHNDKLSLPFEPELMVERRKEEMVEGRMLNPFEESQRKMRKLEGRLEQAEEDIKRMKAAVLHLKGDSESEEEEEGDKKISSYLSLCTLDLIELHVG